MECNEYMGLKWIYVMEMDIKKYEYGIVDIWDNIWIYEYMG